MVDPQFVSLKHATASPAMLSTSPHLDSSELSLRVGATGTPQAEWAAEAISNLRHVIAGVGVALLIEGAAAVAIFATWNLWHLR